MPPDQSPDSARQHALRFAEDFCASAEVILTADVGPGVLPSTVVGVAMHVLSAAATSFALANASNR